MNLINNKKHQTNKFPPPPFFLLNLQAVPNPGADIVANPRVKLVVGAFANQSPNPGPRLIDADVIHVSVSIRNIHLAGGNNLQHTKHNTYYIKHLLYIILQ